MERCAEVETLLLEKYRLIRSGQPAGMDALIAAGDATLAVGTDPQEWWTGHSAVLAAVRAQLEAIGGMAIEPGGPMGWREGPVAWFADRPTLNAEGTVISTRCTGVAVLQDGAWRAVQLHLSVGAANQDTFGTELPV
ncbi:MAG: nuclear transport factor 2 family protein [Actinomycetota bacterium]